MPENANTKPERVMLMVNDIEFQQMCEKFEKADVDGKIKIYVTAEGLNQSQYKELLRMFPVSELAKLEAALG